MSTLTPKQAASIADGVYQLQDETVEDLLRTRRRLGCEGLFSTGASSGFAGRSGVVIRPISGFGYLTEGEGPLKGELLCATRGTAGLVDWLTDFNIGLKSGPGGFQVHAGFQDVWASSVAQMRDYLRGRNPSRIHCVGHSLGGALAMLNADFFTSLGLAVSVYTFGAPRVGSRWFADSLTRRVGPDHVFRMSHIADPVTMFPLFPFVHVPTTRNGYTLGAATPLPVSLSSHFCSSYRTLISDRPWNDFIANDDVMSDLEVQEWMNATDAGSRVQMYSAQGLRSIGRVIAWILKQALTVVGLGFTIGFTLLDRIAWMIGHAVKISAALGTYVVALMRAVFRFLGRAALTTHDLTVSFLRWVLGLLTQTVGGMARKALAHL